MHYFCRLWTMVACLQACHLQMLEYFLNISGVECRVHWEFTLTSRAYYFWWKTILGSSHLTKKNMNSMKIIILSWHFCIRVCHWRLKRVGMLKVTMLCAWSRAVHKKEATYPLELGRSRKLCIWNDKVNAYCGSHYN